MRDPHDLRRALRSLLVDTHSSQSAAARICAASPDLLPVTGAAIAIAGADGSRGTVCVSDSVMARIEDLQFTTGVGPCVDAIVEGRPVLTADLNARDETRWPGFAYEAQRAGVRAIFALPLRIGAIRLGVMDLYRDTPGGLSRPDLADALTVADTATLALIDMHGRKPAGELDQEWWDLDTFYRVEVHQATGVLMQQLDLPAVEALAVLRARAYASGVAVIDLARSVVGSAAPRPPPGSRPDEVSDEGDNVE
jgi:GAF domain-containing protein/ANTAR domain-containing protein